MSPSRKRISPSGVVPKSALDQTTQLLSQLPQKNKDTLTLREAIAQLEAPVTAALAKGYDYDEVANLLTRDGIEVSSASLKYYLTALKRKQGDNHRTKRERGRRTSGQTRSITLLRDPHSSLAAKQEVEDVIAFLLEESPGKPNSPSATASSPSKAAPAQRKTTTLRKRK